MDMRSLDNLTCLERALRDHERWAQVREYQLTHPQTAAEELEWLAQDWVSKASKGARALPPLNAMTLLNLFSRR
jgi:hypothetical protein